LVGLVLDKSEGECTSTHDFTAHHCWDFGILAGLNGIPTDVVLERPVVADIKHAGILILRKGSMTAPATATVQGAVLLGASEPSECAKCRARTDLGCHPNLSKQSYRYSLSDPLCDTFVTQVQPV
jgi:hypothetical protein